MKRANYFIFCMLLNPEHVPKLKNKKNRVNVYRSFFFFLMCITQGYKCFVHTDYGQNENMKKGATHDSEIQKKEQGRSNSRNNKDMAAAVVAVVAVTPVKRDNSHMSPPDKNVQTKVTILTPKFKEMFLSSMRKEMNMQSDGYDTDDQVP